MPTLSHLNQIELSRRWKLSPRTLERWRWQGVGPSYLKLRGRVAYRLQDIEAFEAAQLRAGGAASMLAGAQKGAPIALAPNACSLASTSRHAA
jgi:hypothetical protein